MDIKNKKVSIFGYWGLVGSATDEWFDTIIKNWKLWSERFVNIINDTDKLHDDAFSSRYIFNCDCCDNFTDINIGKVVGWIFVNEEKGFRMKG